MKAPSGIEGIAVILLWPTTRGIFPSSVLTSTRFVGNLSQELSRPLLLQKKYKTITHWYFQVSMQNIGWQNIVVILIWNHT